MRSVTQLAWGAIFLFNSIARADAATYTGIIQSLHVNLQSNMAHVQFVGAPFIDVAGTCPAQWTGNSVDTEKFMKFIWPILLAAKAAGTPITIGTSGCTGSYPTIFSVDSEPRVTS